MADGPWTRFQREAPTAGPWTRFAPQPAPGRGIGGRSREETMRLMRERSEAAGGRAAAERRAAEATQAAEDEIVLARDPALFRGAVSFLQGVPFLGEWTDEIMGGAVDMLTGREGSARYIQQTQDAMERQRPWASGALQLAGGITGAIPLAGLAAPAVSAAAPASIGGQAFAAGVAGAGAGAIEGAVSGAGRNEADRMRGAGTGALLGGGLGAVVGAAAPLVAAGVRNFLNRLRTSDVSTIARQFGVSREAASVVKRSLMNDDLDAAEAALRRAGADAMLADAGPGTRQLLDDAMSAGGAATRIGREAVEGRAATAAPEITKALDDVLGSPQGIRATARGISARTAPLRQEAYRRAYEAPIDYASQQGRRIEEVLARIPPNTLRAAVDEANEAMTAAGQRNMQIMAQIADDGSVTFREMPNVQQLDEIKKALGSIAASEVDNFGRRNARGVRAARLATELRDAIAEAVPPYRTAVRLGGDKIAEDQALDLGRRAFTAQRGIREEVAEFVAGKPSREALDAFKRGLRAYIDDAMARVQRTITDPNVDAREALIPIKSLSSRQNRETISEVLGEAQARRLFNIIDRETMKLELRAGVARNSQTAIRLAGRQAMDTALEPGPIGAAARGRPVNAAQRIIQTLTATTPEDDLARRQELYAQIADALTRIRGPEAERAMASVRAAMQGQPLAEAEARRIANMVSTATALGGYQAGTQFLAR